MTQPLSDLCPVCKQWDCAASAHGITNGQRKALLAMCHPIKPERKKELEETALKITESLNLNSQERRLAGLMGPFLQVLFHDVKEESQTKVLKLFYDFQLIKEKTVKDVHSTQSEEPPKP